MSLADRVRWLLDNTTQRSAAWYSDHPKPDPDCTRCRRHPHAAGSDWCPGCRAWMRGDSDEDPKPPDPEPGVDWNTVNA